MTTHAYCRCNSGHYFMGEYCPFDGWSSSASRELTHAVEQLARQERPISMEELRSLGVSPATLARVIVIDFGSPDSVFEAISPQECVVQGEALPVHKLSKSLK